MGKGDKKTKRGKIIKGSYGVRRPKKTSVSPIPVKAKKEAVKKVAEVVEEKPVKKTPAKKVAAKKTEDKPIVEKETKAKAVPAKEEKPKSKKKEV